MSARRRVSVDKQDEEEGTKAANATIQSNDLANEEKSVDENLKDLASSFCSEISERCNVKRCNVKFSNKSRVNMPRKNLKSYHGEILEDFERTSLMCSYVLSKVILHS